MAPHVFRNDNPVHGMDASPSNSPDEFNDAMCQLGTGYALHTEATHTPFIRQPREDLSQAFRHLDIRDPVDGNVSGAGAVVPRGLNPSPLVLAPQNVRPQAWSLSHPQITYGGVYGDRAGFGNQYVGHLGVIRPVEEPYAYCLDRGDGEYTRLIPADMLPEMQDVPRRQQDAEGMAVLPVPGGRAPRGVQGVTCPVRFKVSNVVNRYPRRFCCLLLL